MFGYFFYPGCVGCGSSSSRLTVPETSGVRFGAEQQFVRHEDSSEASDDDEFVSRASFFFKKKQKQNWVC